jgi:hypothetical protein
MVFDATPTNLTEVLVVALAVVSVIMLMKKRYDSNLPLLFFLTAVLFTTTVDRPIHPYLMYGSLACALLLRFEFMNQAFSRLVAFVTAVGLSMIIYVMMTDVLIF